MQSDTTATDLSDELLTGSRNLASCQVAPHALGEGRCSASVPEDSPIALAKFSETQNPFLFPLTLLDNWAEPHLQVRSPFPESNGHNGRQGRTATVGGSCIDEVRSTHDAPRWWLVHTKPRQEKKLSEQLRNLQVSHYLPVTKCKAVTRGRTRITRLPQFPSYLFLWVSPDQRMAALKTNRIVATHCVENQDNLGHQIWNLADLIEKGVPLRVEERLAAGQPVRVKSGPLKDKQGTIIMRGGKTRLFVFVNELLGGVSVEIEQHLIEPYH